MNRDTGERVGNSKGRVEEVEVDDYGIGWGQFLRVEVEMDLKKAIARWRTIKVNGSRVWIHLKYEKLLRLCFTC